ncbi:glycoside hydrolase superfamily [Chlamydoabsidia padenii]|nr:glycoside hydrolase superfamily [Chlamydoabsidia padenii]
MGLFKKSPPDSSEYIIKEAIHNTKDRHPPSNQSWWQHKRTRFVIIGALTIIVIALAVIVPLIIVHQIQQVHNNSVHPESSPNPDPENIQDNSTTTEPPPPPPPVNPFDDSAQANNHVPPLNQSFPYTRTPIRGINLGGWLVLEPFITPSLFEQAPDPTKKPQERHETKDHVALDEWTLCQRLGPTRSRELLEHHYDTFITESDFKTMSEMGFNHVRIPIGHWAIRPLAREPFVPYVSWTYLIRGIQWARKYGLRVMVELHTAPGSQNGWNHSGRSGEIRFLHGENGQKYAEDTMRVVRDIVTFFSTDPITRQQGQSYPSQWAHVVPIFGVLNEPAMMTIKKEDAQQWYRESYATIRNITGGSAGPVLSYHEGFLGLDRWKGFFKNFERIILETHMYLIFNPDLVNMEREKQAAFPCDTWRSQLLQSTKEVAPTMVGEFSFATNDCGKYVNGVGYGTRYENTMEGGDSKCTNCNCTNVNDWGSWTLDYKRFLNTFIQHQMDAYEAGVGWFFWTYKTEQHINPHWDYSLAWEQGWAPKDVNQRDFFCINS